MLSSPFLGMDPFLEGHVWPDVHQSIAFTIKEQIAPQVIPKYFVRIETYTVEDTHPEKDVSILYPDVEVLRRKKMPTASALQTAEGTAKALTPATLILPTTQRIEVRIPVVEIRDVENNQLITAIEILSPVNKRKPGLTPYRKKRKLLSEDGVHLLEIDLLRRGERPFDHPRIPENTHYMVTLIRSNASMLSIWAMNIRDKLPIVPVPLQATDEDVRLDIGKALTDVYQRSYYRYSVDYEGTIPPPEFSKEDKVYIKTVLAKLKTN